MNVESSLYFGRASADKLTGSARMTTWTVALPGVSRETYGVRIVWLASFIIFSMPGRSPPGAENAMRPKAFAWFTGPPMTNEQHNILL